MPRGDGTGPAGMGPMTGRAAGFCAGYPVPGYMNPVSGRGFGGYGRGYWGRGGGRGRRNWFYATGAPGWAGAAWGMPAWGGLFPVSYGMYPAAPGATAEHELTALKQQADYFQDALEQIKQRMTEIEQESKK